MYSVDKKLFGDGWVHSASMRVDGIPTTVSSEWFVSSNVDRGIIVVYGSGVNSTANGISYTKPLVPGSKSMYGGRLDFDTGFRPDSALIWEHTAIYIPRISTSQAAGLGWAPIMLGTDGRIYLYARGYSGGSIGANEIDFVPRAVLDVSIP